MANEATIDKLNIDITASAANAIKSINSLKNCLVKFQKAQAEATWDGMKACTDTLKTMADALNSIDLQRLKMLYAVIGKMNRTTVTAKAAENIKAAASAITAATETGKGEYTGGESGQDIADEQGKEKSLKGWKKWANGVVKATQTAGNGLTKFMKRVGRMAVTMILRTIIRGALEAVKDGLENLYSYSSTFGTAFSEQVDELKNRFMLLKNSLATALRPALEAIIPILNNLITKLATAADKVAQFMSAFFGKVDSAGNYTKAVYSNIANATDEAKELKRTLLGFDELNVLNGDSSSSTSTDTSTMFVQAKIDDNIVALVKKVKAFFAEVEEYMLKVARVFYQVVIAVASLAKAVLTVLDFLDPLIRVFLGAIALAVGNFLFTVKGLWVSLLTALKKTLWSLVKWNYDLVIALKQLLGQDTTDLEHWRDVYDAAIDEADDSFDEFNREWKNFNESILTFTETSTDYSSAISVMDGVIDSAKANIGELTNKIAAMSASAKTTSATVVKTVEAVKTEVAATATAASTKSASFIRSTLGTDMSTTFSSIAKARGFASGGYPSQGSVFLAGEAGPEYVGSVGGQTGVWNSDQLIQGLYRAVSAAMAENGGTTAVQLNLDGEVIYKDVVRRNNNRYRSSGRSALMV